MSVSSPDGSTGFVPRIDVSPILDGQFETQAARAVLDPIREACADIGFMTITGHGIPRQTIDSAAAAAERFFALPDATKREASPRKWNAASRNVYRGYFPSSVEGKEGLDVGDPDLEDPALLARPYHERNRFPSQLDEAWQDVMREAFDAFSTLGRTLLGAMVAAIGGDPARVEAAFARPAALSTLRFNAYPERDTPVSISPQDGAPLSCEAHVDSGFLTLLYQDDRGGLQLRGADRVWRDVEPDADAIVVNTGLALQRMTGRALVATLHRVLHQRRRRLSIPFFLEPVPDFAIAPRSLALPFPAQGEGERYEDFLRASLAKFAEYDR